jgi:general secretion pathway protein D
MKCPPILLIVSALLLISLPLYADQAGADYKRGVEAENHGQLDAAYAAYSQAHALKPKETKYFVAYTRVRFQASMEHLKSGQKLLDAGKLAEALAEFQRAAEIDATNFLAQEEVQRVSDIIRKQAAKQAASAAVQSPLAKQAQEAGGPVELTGLSSTLINLRLSENSTMVYKTIGKLAGVNVLFDPDYKGQKITIELVDVTLREALDMVALESKTFWQPTSSNTILVAADTTAKRKEVQSTVMKWFYLKNATAATDLQEAASALKGILDLSRVQLIPNQNALIVRGTPDQLVLAEKVLTDIDKPKPEVVIEVAVMQVSRSKVRTLGAIPPTSASLYVTAPGVIPVPTTGSGTGTTTTTPAPTTGGGGSAPINALRYLNASNFIVTLPSYSFTALLSDSNTKLIQRPELWALDNEKTTMKVGDRIPIATGSFGATGGTQGYGALVNTQFQYIDVGVNIDITPHIHSDSEVTLKMTLEISSVTGTQNLGGINQPVIGQRRLDLESRLQDGDVNLVGGILEDTETQSLSGYPWLAQIPVLKYLFAQEDKQRQENEIVFAIMPHIVRALEVTDDNLRLIDLGAGNTVTVRHTDAKKPGPTPAAAPPDGGASPNGGAAGSHPKTPATPSSQAPSESAPGSGSSSPGTPMAPTKSSPPGNSAPAANPSGP